MDNAIKGISRRSFLRGGATVAAVAVGSSLIGCSGAPKKAAWEPEKWDEETDVVVVGYGGAGIAAAITMKNENLGEVIVVEAAPKEYEGGNTRVSGNILFTVDTVDGAFAYQKELNGAYVIDDSLLKAWAEQLGENVQWIEGLGGVMKTIPRTAEFAQAASADQVKIYCVDGSYGNGSLWHFLKSKEADMGYQVIHDARVTDLIRNTETNEACGVIASLADGTTVTVKAKKAVILSCGGFENNLDLVQNHYQPGTTHTGYFGTPFNRGDGFGCVEPFGAKLWHMNSYSGGQINAVLYKEGYTTSVKPAGKGWIYVGADSTRFMYEETRDVQRHGKIKFHGSYMNYPAPDPIHLIMGAKALETAKPFAPRATLMWPSQNGMIPEGGLSGEEFVKSGMIVKADTIEELATKIGRDPAALAQTVAEYNEYCAQGKDSAFGRGEAYYEYGHTGIGGGNEAAVMTTEKVAVIKPFDLEALEGPFYAVEMRASFINTQGGPKRNENCQVVNSKNEPIPRLYGAGEFGSIYGYEYNGGGNVSEAIATGRTAARHAGTLDAWDKSKA